MLMILPEFFLWYLLLPTPILRMCVMCLIYKQFKNKCQIKIVLCCSSWFHFGLCRGGEGAWSCDAVRLTEAFWF